MAHDITLTDVRHMASLSRLIIGEEEEALFCRQFGDILEHVNSLQGVDTEAIEPLYTPVQHPGFTREDFACDLRSRKEILANAPETDGESFIVPRII